MKNKNYYANTRLWLKNRLIKLKQTENKCEVCGIKTKRLHIHHKDFSKSNHNIENLIIVCPKCHKNLHRQIWICSYDGCLENHYALGLCLFHWRKFTMKEKQDNSLWKERNDIEAKEIVNYALTCLTERQRTIINLRFIEGKTLQNVAQVLQVTRERVRQMEANALKTMHNKTTKKFLTNLDLSL